MWSKMIQRLLNEENLLIGISELSEIAEVSPRQLRYWEEKGIINSQDSKEGSTRRFDYINIKKMLLIQEMLEEGFTLDFAAKKVEKRLAALNAMFKNLVEELKDIDK